MPTIGPRILWVAAAALALDSCRDVDVDVLPEPSIRFADILPHRGEPSAAEDWSFAPFSDQGAWFGMALSSNGFSGPFLMTSGRWLRPELSRLDLVDGSSGERLAPDSERAAALPGMLRRHETGSDLDWTRELWFDTSETAVLRVRVHNRGAVVRRLVLAWSGSLYTSDGRLERADDSVVVRRESGESFRLERSGGSGSFALSAAGYELREEVTLAPGEIQSRAVTLSFALDGEPPSAAAVDPEASYARNRRRWSRYLEAVDTGLDPEAPEQILAVKALQTLVNNWRAPAGRMRHSALFPSSNVDYFNGFWAWDSFKHAVGLVRFDAALAKEQVRAMFDHQDDTGMIADVVYLDPSEDNWRDTKPPLAGWAIETIWEATGDLDFVRDLYPKLVAYHEFWYADRDHDGDGLCEYGSTDGSLEAARWESGMDNAVRFDDARMLANGPRAWSMNQESVDLNAYLYREKLALAVLARALERQDDEARYSREAQELRTRIQDAMYDEVSGWFYDIDVDSGAHVAVQGPEGFIPLWAGVASEAQAERARVTLLDEERFRTYVPFPTVSRSHPEFSDGYWRGLVWLDQAYFAIEGLKRYGYHDDADVLTSELFERLEGATTPGQPLYENYDPLTGEGRNVEHFSWTAAHLLLLALDRRR